MWSKSKKVERKRQKIKMKAIQVQCPKCNFLKKEEVGIVLLKENLRSPTKFPIQKQTSL